MENKELLKKLNETNLLSLAFIGDAVHTLFVRRQILEAEGKMNNYHTQASKYCKAAAQAKAMKKLTPLLSEKEQTIVRRARNAKPHHQAKNATSADYNEATMFEALIGYLYLSDNHERLEQFLKLSI